MGLLRSALLVAVAAAAGWWVLRHQRGAVGDDDLPLALTVHRPLSELSDELAQEREMPLTDLGLEGRLDLAPAPGTFGTELRIGSHSGDHQGRTDARQALRKAKQLLETGHVMPPDRPVTRRRTLTSIPLEIAIRQAGMGGRL